MLKKFLKSVVYYGIPQLIVFAVILYFGRPYIKEYLFEYIGISERSSLFDLADIGMDLFLVYIVAYIAFTTIRSKRYYVLTGRSYGADQKFKRSYASLVDYFKDSDKHKMDTEKFPEMSWREAKGLVLGKFQKKLITFPASSETNICIFGPPGSGKTAGLGIINVISMIHAGGSALVIDIKGDIFNFVSKFFEGKGTRLLRFCPDDPDAIEKSCHFDPFNGLSEMDATEKKTYIDSMALVLIPDTGGSDGDYYTKTARKLFCGIAHLLLYENKNLSFPDLVHAILHGNVFDWVTRGMNSECSEASELLSGMYGQSEKNISGAQDCLCTAIINFSNPVLDVLLGKDDPDKCISVKNLDKGESIFLQISQEHLDTYAPLFTLILQTLSMQMTKRPDKSTPEGKKNRPILMLMDEFPQLTFSYKMINADLSTLRSKVCQIVIIQQNFSQLSYKYKVDGARSILGNCDCQVILGSNDYVTSKEWSDKIGTKKVLKLSNSVTMSEHSSSGNSVSEAREPVFFPEDFGDLGEKKDLVIYYKGKYLKCKKLNCYID